jgi:TatD DNase family protein
MMDHPTYVELFRRIAAWRRIGEKEILCRWEIGIDLYWDKTHLPEQQIAFRKQIQLAKQYKLPIVIHCRELSWWWNIRRKRSQLIYLGSFFTGTYEQALQAISYNMKLELVESLLLKNGKIDQFWIKLI